MRCRGCRRHGRRGRGGRGIGSCEPPADPRAEKRHRDPRGDEGPASPRGGTGRLFPIGGWRLGLHRRAVGDGCLHRQVGIPVRIGVGGAVPPDRRGLGPGPDLLRPARAAVALRTRLPALRTHGHLSTPVSRRPGGADSSNALLVGTPVFGVRFYYSVVRLRSHRSCAFLPLGFTHNGIETPPVRKNRWAGPSRRRPTSEGPPAPGSAVRHRGPEARFRCGSAGR